jgi:predicted metal-dependent peptidase
LSTDIHRILTSISIQLLLDSPFYAHLLSGLLKRVDERVDTLAVGLHGRDQLALYINPAFFRRLPSDVEREGVLQHELLHIALGHLFLAKAYPHRQLFNIAADLVVNQYIPDHKLPEGALRLEQFSGLKLEREREVGYYYYKLLKEHRQPGYPEDAQRLRAWLNGEGGAEEALDRHRLWQGVLRASKAEQDQLEANFAAVVSSISQKIGGYAFGQLPAALQAYLKAIMPEPPTVDWRRVLRLFAASSATTTVRNTIRRPSRRYGTVPGTKVQPRQKLLVAIDSSGSISERDLSLFFAEIQHLWRQRAEVRIVECDTAIKKVYDYRGQPPEQVSGRGGTRFDAPIQYANQNYRPDALVYFTDGMGPKPVVASRYPILWLITPNGISPANDRWYELPGQVVKMKSNDA